jgi:hypothetical protein
MITISTPVSVDTEDPYYCPFCGVSPCAGLTEDC